MTKNNIRKEILEEVTALKAERSASKVARKTAMENTLITGKIVVVAMAIATMVVITGANLYKYVQQKFPEYFIPQPQVVQTPTNRLNTFLSTSEQNVTQASTQKNNVIVNLYVDGKLTKHNVVSSSSTPNTTKKSNTQNYNSSEKTVTEVDGKMKYKGKIYKSREEVNSDDKLSITEKNKLKEFIRTHNLFRFKTFNTTYKGKDGQNDAKRKACSEMVVSSSVLNNKILAQIEAKHFADARTLIALPEFKNNIYNMNKACDGVMSKKQLENQNTAMKNQKNILLDVIKAL